jgi:hypothetical protein
VVLGFAFTAWYALLAYVAGAYLLWRTFAGQLVADARTVRRALRPEPTQTPPTPVVVLGHPGYSYSTTTFPERRLEEREYLTRLDPSYLIENKDATITVTDVTTGVRRRDDGREHTFAEFKAPALAPRETAPVRGVSIPHDLFDGLTEQDYEGAFFFWARFTALGGERCEVTYDPVAREHSRTLIEN